MRRAPRHTRRGVCGEEEGRTLTKGKRAYLRACLRACLPACLPACLRACLALPRTTTPLGEGIVEPVYRRLLPKARLRRVSSRPAWGLLGTYSTPTLPLLYPCSTPTLLLLYSYSTPTLLLLYPYSTPTLLEPCGVWLTVSTRQWNASIAPT